MTNLDSTLKNRDISLPTKVCLVKAMVFPVIMYGCESWTVKKAEHWRIDAFELSCWRKPSRVPWTARRSNQSILKEIIPGISLEGMMLKLKLQYFGHLMWRVDSLEKTVMLGGIWGRRRRGRQRMTWPDDITDLMDGQGGLACCNSWSCKELDTTEWLNWTEYSSKNKTFNGCRIFHYKFVCHKFFELIPYHWTSSQKHFYKLILWWALFCLASVLYQIALMLFL